jgi:hypothetical protein
MSESVALPDFQKSPPKHPAKPVVSTQPSQPACRPAEHIRFYRLARPPADLRPAW